MIERYLYPTASLINDALPTENTIFGGACEQNIQTSYRILVQILPGVGLGNYITAQSTESWPFGKYFGTVNKNNLAKKNNTTRYNQLVSKNISLLLLNFGNRL